MLLSLKNVAPYLLECGLIRPEVIIEGDLLILEIPRGGI